MIQYCFLSFFFSVYTYYLYLIQIFAGGNCCFLPVSKFRYLFLYLNFHWISNRKGFPVRRRLATKEINLEMPSFSLSLSEDPFFYMLCQKTIQYAITPQ